jgi:hypothetical protein
LEEGVVADRSTTEMIGGTIQEVEAVLGRTTTWAEAAWFRYSAAMPDRWLLCHSLLISGVFYMVVPLPILVVQRLAPAVTSRYKLQPKVAPSSPSPAAILRYIRSSGASMLLGFVSHLLMYLVTFKVHTYIYSICINLTDLIIMQSVDSSFMHICMYVCMVIDTNIRR